jgi:hypothetical protein|tara:strand:- start:1420 stop:1656 length:237 start_codon:yes stop_codon:yes gene_type:complete
MYKLVWKRNPMKHYHIGMKANGSTIVGIRHPETYEQNAYIEQWHGMPIKKNPRYMNIVLASGETIKSTELVRDLEDVV